MMTLYQKLISIMHRLYESPRPEDYTECEEPLGDYGSTRDALLYALVYLPEFIQVEDSVLINCFRVDSGRFPQSFIDAKNEHDWPINKLEDSFNYVETSYIFAGHTKIYTDEDDQLFAECVAEAWRGRLALLYPKRRFKVSVIGPPESGDAYGVSFYELR